MDTRKLHVKNAFPLVSNVLIVQKQFANRQLMLILFVVLILLLLLLRAQYTSDHRKPRINIRTMVPFINTLIITLTKITIIKLISIIQLSITPIIFPSII